jgi:AbrB family looped-hinge helix DNA binding protein
MASQRLTTTVSTKGQVILPKELRDRRHWPAGTQFVVEETKDGVLLKPVRRFPPTRHEDVAGMLKYDGPPVSIEDMDAGVLEEAKRRYDRSRY